MTLTLLIACESGAGKGGTVQGSERGRVDNLSAFLVQRAGREFQGHEIGRGVGRREAFGEVGGEAEAAVVIGRAKQENGASARQRAGAFSLEKTIWPAISPPSSATRDSAASPESRSASTKSVSPS